MALIALRFYIRSVYHFWYTSLFLTCLAFLVAYYFVCVFNSLAVIGLGGPFFADNSRKLADLLLSMQLIINFGRRKSIVIRDLIHIIT
jgi:hypothetical protein